jgi:LPS-assembly protein
MPRRRAARLGALALALAVWLGSGVTPALAQQDALQLAAGSLRLEADGRLVAEGGVEALWQDMRLSAEALIYRRGAAGAPDRLELTGPIRLERGDDILVLAEAAELSADLRDGLMTGVRMVLDRRMQIAAQELAISDGRARRLERVVASSCRVCADRPVPLWEVRARRITHDPEEQRLILEGAAFRIGGRTVAVLPRMTLPDPDVTRATGFLVPEILSSGALGPGIRIPYFVVLGPDRDVTILPRIHSSGSYTLGGRYRQAFNGGWLEVEAAVTRDQIRPDETRGYLAATADFALGADSSFGLRLELPSDPRYRSDYGIGTEDIRENTVFLLRRSRDRLDRLRLTQFRLYQGSVDNRFLPNEVLDAVVERRFTMPGVGGIAELAVEALVAGRRSNDPVMGAGRDRARLTARFDWRRDWLLPGGVQAAALADVQADYWRLRQDDTRPERIDRFTPALGVELRWPLLRAGTGGVRHLLEPVAQIVWAPDDDSAAPNDDSLLVEFDEAALFSLHRFAGRDARETGARANLGISWTRIDPAGWSVSLAAGRVLRERAGAGFDVDSGLAGQESDWLAGLRLETASGLVLAGRATIDDSGRMRRQEFRFGYTDGELGVVANYVHLEANAAEDRPDRSSELGLDGRLALNMNWTAQADLRYDVARREMGRAGVSAQYRNECLAVDVSLSRRFVSSTSVAAQTEFGLRVDLLGFGGGAAGPTRSCAR